MIIEFAIETRTVKISHAGTLSQAMIDSPFCKVVSPVITKTPALLHVNKFVREIALKSYRLIPNGGYHLPDQQRHRLGHIDMTSNIHDHGNHKTENLHEQRSRS
ncbi:hypothetical protein ACEPPN_003602 [Leptodophora sp. 'Broadleaf-Isolate-01']